MYPLHRKGTIPSTSLVFAAARRCVCPCEMAILAGRVVEAFGNGALPGRFTGNAPSEIYLQCVIVAWMMVPSSQKQNTLKKKDRSQRLVPKNPGVLTCYAFHWSVASCEVIAFSAPVAARHIFSFSGNLFDWFGTNWIWDFKDSRKLKANY